jgi:phenylalanyl-tRNA synthetase alpha chain
MNYDLSYMQMEGFRVFSPDDWSGSGVDGTAYAATDLKKTLEGLATHLFGKTRMACFLLSKEVIK